MVGETWLFSQQRAQIQNHPAGKPIAQRRAPKMRVERLRLGVEGIGDAYSTPSWTPIPRQTGHPVQRKLDSDSSANWTPVPGQIGHLK
jgi:hypothetical protein